MQESERTWKDPSCQGDLFFANSYRAFAKTLVEVIEGSFLIGVFYFGLVLKRLYTDNCPFCYPSSACGSLHCTSLEVSGILPSFFRSVHTVWTEVSKRAPS